MAVVQRFFSTTSAGAADGTTWANRADLFSGGNWSTVITGFAFNGSDSLECLIGPGNYSCGQALASGLFANAPTIANPLFLVGCDSSGVKLAIPDPDWTSDQPAWSDATLPVIATTTNIATIGLSTAYLMLLKLTASARNGAVITTVGMTQWCQVINATANSAAIASAQGRGYGSVYQCTGSSYDSVISGQVTVPMFNVRVEGVAGSSGNRRGVTLTGNSNYLDAFTVINNGGEGVISTSTGAGQAIRMHRCVIANNGAAGFKPNSTASQTDNFELHHCMVTGNGGYGVDGNSAAGRVIVAGCRFRDNSSGNITGLGNYPTDFNNYTTDSDDATEYVSAGANGDFRIKAGSAIHGMGFGVSDEPAASGGGGQAISIFGG